MISVVIPAYNEGKNISKCLEALCRQTTEQKFEVILVDNNSSDNTIAEAEKFQDKLDLQIVSQMKKGRSPAREKGFQIASGQIIFSTDADTVVPPDWIHELLQVFADENVVAVTGTCAINDCTAVTNSLFNLVQPISMHLYRLVFGHFWLSGFSFAIRQSAYKKSGGFDNSLNALEDIDLAFRVSRLGRIRFYGRSPVLFSGRRFREDGLLRGFWSYVASFWQYYSGKRSKVYLSDIR